MKFVKYVLIKIGIQNQAKYIRNVLLLIINYWQDALNYFKYSYVFHKKGFSKYEADIIMSYHSIEKGFLHEKIKNRFAKDKVIAIIKDIDCLMKNNKIIVNSQIISAINVLLEYYEYHNKIGIDIYDYFSSEKYNEFLKYKKDNFKSVHFLEKSEFYKKTNLNFFEFSHSRRSIRNFTGEKISNKSLNSVIQLANNSPSVCNRQSCKVYLINNKENIDNILKIQGGFRGYDKNVSQLLILVANKNAFYSIGERNQMYIDGGIYLMNLLYSLHFYKIASCPANWGKCVQDDKSVRKYVNIPLCEQIICTIPIGIATEEVVYANSERRTVTETLVVSD
ncbi:Nitroreductase family protein [Acinetobacter johnsonii]|uniref:nitroreductase family protein n=1 Tax=Acinetobacter johnsonii TaxID=40214 RepID=UPI000B7C43E2|nr:nitroreductase family protein [Acinetobacter johnsonii]SNU15106.1 Nitroreductase family protein [Acinetobacter johnsonii]